MANVLYNCCADTFVISFVSASSVTEFGGLLRVCSGLHIEFLYSLLNLYFKRVFIHVNAFLWRSMAFDLNCMFPP